MPLRFDLSEAFETPQKISNLKQVVPPISLNFQNTLHQPLQTHQHQPLQHQPQQPLTFTIGGYSQPTGLVRRFAAPVLERLGIGQQQKFDDTKCQRADDESNDQYSIKQGKGMTWSVLFKNDTGRSHPNSLLGDFGHAERLPAWVHLVAGVAFGVYTVVRPIAITKEHTAAELWTTLAAAAVCFCFLSSTIYHITSPSQRLAFWTRQIDYTGIYAAIAFGSVADYSIATRSFENVSWISIVDGPIAALCTCVFFLARRGLLPSSDTWSSYLGGCTVNFGLFRRMHIDKAHTGTRQATSFLIAISYFVSTPSLFRTVGTENALVVLGLEIGCLILLIFGMVIDNAFVWPDVSLSRGKGPSFLVCKPCGCIGSAHSIWHVLSVIAAVKGAIAREMALSWQ